MFAYVTTHFINHSMGLISVQFMDPVLHSLHGYWSSQLGGIITFTAFVTHYGLALWALWERRSLKMSMPEAFQLVLGFSIPFLLIEHVMNTRVADTYFDAAYGYYTALL